MTLSTSLKLASLSLILSDVLCLKSPAPITIQVCQNKDCCRRFQAQSKLPEVLEDLLDDSVSIQATGCLSHCGKGPNVCIKHLGKAGFRGGITNPSLAVLFLEEELQEQPLSTKRIAAVKVLEKGHQGM